MEVDYPLSQDIFKTQSEHLEPIGSPTKGKLLNEWKCEEASDETFIAWDEQSSSLGSHYLPSLGISDHFPDIVQIGSSEIPFLEVASERASFDGIDCLTSLATKYFFQMRDNTDQRAMQNYLHALTIFEQLGISGKLCDKTLSHLDASLHRLVKKVAGSLPESFNGEIFSNPTFHVPLFTFKVAFTLFTANSTEETAQRRVPLLKDVLFLIAVTAVRVYDSFKTVAPCSCFQSFIFMLFRDRQSKFDKAFVETFLNVSNNKRFLSEKLIKSAVPSTTMFFSFYVATTEYLLKLNKIGKGSEFTANFVHRIFGMGDQLAKKKLSAVCEVLSGFLKRNDTIRLQRFAVISKTLWKLIEYEISKETSSEMEDLCKEPAIIWAEQVLEDFNNAKSNGVLVKQVHMIRLLTLLTRDQDVFNALEQSRISAFFNRPADHTIIGCVLSLLLSLLTNEHVARSLSNQLPQYFSSMAKTGNESVLKALLKANEVGRKICRTHSSVHEFYQYNKIMGNLLNQIPLPASKSLFLDAVLALSPNDEIKYLDLTRTAIATNLPEYDFRRLLVHYTDADSTLPNSLWIRAKAMADNGDSKAMDFFINQLCVGLHNKQPFFTQQLKKLLEKCEKNKTPTVEMLHLMSRLLSSRVELNVDDFVALWISCVIAFSASNELETRSLCDNVWEKLRPSLSVLSPSSELTMMSQAQSIDFVARLIEVLPPCSNASQQKLFIWFPFWLCQNLQSIILQKGQVSVENRTSVLRVFCALLERHSATLFSMAQANSQRQPFNQSVLVIAVCSIADKRVIHDPFVVQNIRQIVNGLSEIPENGNKTVFIHSRIKEILTQFVAQPNVSVPLLNVLREKGVYLEKLKRENPLIAQLCKENGF